MQNNLDKSRGRDSETAIRVKRTAVIVGVSKRTVYRVIRGDAKLDAETIEKVLHVFMSLEDGENKLVEAVKEAVPFN